MKHSAMTLLEVTAALAIVVMMTGATAGVLTSMNHKREILDQFVGKEPWQCRMADRWREDVVSTIRMRVGPNFVEFVGGCAHDAVSGETTALPVLIQWQIVSVGERKGLFRRETPTGTTDNEPPHTELIGMGIGRIECGAYTATDTEAQGEFGGTNQGRVRATGDWTTLGRGLRLILYDEQDSVIIDEVVLR